MRKLIVGLVGLLTVISVTFLVAQREKTLNFIVEDTQVIPWGNGDLPYHRGTGMNISYLSFQTEGDVMYFLDWGNNRILKHEGEGTSELFKLPFTPRDFVFKNGLFYVLDRNMISVIDLNGVPVREVQLPKEIRSYHKLEVNNDNQLYAMLPNGKSLVVELDDNSDEGRLISGWPTIGFATETIRKGNLEYEVVTYSEDGQVLNSKTIDSDRKLGSVVIQGVLGNHLLVLKEEIVKELPLIVDRTLQAIEVSEAGEIGAVDAEIVLPNQYYTYAKHHLVIEDGRIVQLISAEDGCHVFELTLTTETSAGYPVWMHEQQYFFNDHTLKFTD